MKAFSNFNKTFYFEVCISRSKLGKHCAKKGNVWGLVKLNVKLSYVRLLDRKKELS